MSLFSSLGHKVVKCPRCSGRLRLPNRPGKAFRVTCSHCSEQFETSLTGPSSLGVPYKMLFIYMAILLLGIIIGIWLSGSGEFSQYISPLFK